MSNHAESHVALFTENGEEWNNPDGTKSPIEWNRNEKATRLVIGSLDEEKSIELILPEAPGMTLEYLYPNLTHLHLWGVSNLEKLSMLPGQLVELDVRNCSALKTIARLPDGLTTLILNNNPGLTLGADLALGKLVDLDIAGCSEVEQTTVNNLLAQARELTKFNASSLTKLQLIKYWPEKLTSIKLNHCSNLQALPGKWPANLYRLELAGARNLQRLADFPHSEATPDNPDPLSTPDYVNLCHTHALRTLPKQRGRPRSLFLYDSGLQLPPATEHGESVNENVAAKTNGYFDDCELFGEGSVQRCKVQLLGNGRAGKTSLALCLTKKDPRQAEADGSTHGVRFHNYEVAATVDGFSSKVSTNLWDFGGQEIYHGTHRLFMSKGSVFVVLWHAEQDGKTAPEEACGFQDEWRPLQYWIDLIYANSKTPDIVVICSHQSKPSDAIKERYKRSLSVEDGRETPPLYFVDSLNKSGQLEELESWLGQRVGGVIQAQGQAVPSYWELAQEMVQRWLQKLQDTNPDEAGRVMTEETFKVELSEVVARSIREDPDRFPVLRQAFESNEFDLTEDRIRRTLGFLTNSGWLFWSEDLFQRQVIVDQQWALRGLYDLLDRRKNAAVYSELLSQGGIFTQQSLADLVWNKRAYTDDHQQLMLSYMEICDLAFKYRDKSDSWIGEQIYVSYEHLPSAKDSRIDSEFADLGSAPEKIENKRMFRYHWQQFLIKIGRQFGASANYAKDGLSIHTKTGASALVLLALNEDAGVGGAINLVTLRDPDNELAAVLKNQLESILPRDDGLETGDVAQDNTEGVESSDTLEVFISYTKNNGTEDYEETKRAVKAFLDRYNAERPDEAVYVKRIIDEDDLKAGESINNFMKQSAKSAMVLVLHNDKYLKSDYAMYELAHAFKHCTRTIGKSDATAIVPLGNNNLLDISTESHLEKYEEYWKKKDSPELKSGWDVDRQKLRRLAINALYDLSELCGDASGGKTSLNIKWSDGEEQALKRLADRLGISYPDRLEAL